MALRLVGFGLVALGLVALALALAATLASALAAAAATAFAACAVNVRKFVNFEITHMYSPVKIAPGRFPGFFPCECRSWRQAMGDCESSASIMLINH
jgi:hypothetical protein